MRYKYVTSPLLSGTPCFTYESRDLQVLERAEWGYEA